jgi:hypothetical protein
MWEKELNMMGGECTRAGLNDFSRSCSSCLGIGDTEAINTFPRELLLPVDYYATRL